MRPASKGWEIEYTKRLGYIGFLPGKVSLCCFHGESDDVSIVVHADDFVFEGPPSVFDEIVKSLQKHWIIKVRAIVGPQKTDDKEVNRVVTRVASSTKPILATGKSFCGVMSMTGCREFSSPGVKATAEEAEEGSLYSQVMRSRSTGPAWQDAIT